MKTILTLLTVAIAITHSLAQKTTKETVGFDYNKSDLSADSKSKLDQAFGNIKSKDIAQINITGFTDSDGGDKYNKTLSEDRALTVLNYLAAKGIDKDKIVTGYNGEQQPVASNDNRIGKQQNRRVELLIETFDFAVPEAFTAANTKFQINPNRDTIVKIKSKGTLLHVPANSFCDKLGAPVKETVTLNYREYTNSAEIAFSGIPMVYKNKGEEFCFNSSGMFEITGTVKEEPVKVAKGKNLTVDYALAKQNPDINFYRLNDDKNNWANIQNIKPIEKKKSAMDAAEAKEKSKFRDEPAPMREGGDFNMGVFKDDGNRTNGTLLAEGMGAGHTYPDIVKGLNVGSFGVYNCDQIYRLPNRIDVVAKFVDTDGNEIRNLHVLSLIDLNYNGAFSFDPAGFTCDAKGKNVLALFTKKGKFYILDKQEFAKMEITKNGEYTFVMQNLTDKIKNSKDLAEYLGIKI